MERRNDEAEAATQRRETHDPDTRDLAQGTRGHTSGSADHGKPGERVPPGQETLRTQPEADKAPGVGGGPSPVGENDLA